MPCQPSTVEANRKISAYIGDLIEQRRSMPGDYLISVVLGQRSTTPRPVANVHLLTS